MRREERAKAERCPALAGSREKPIPFHFQTFPDRIRPRPFPRSCLPKSLLLLLLLCRLRNFSSQNKEIQRRPTARGRFSARDAMRKLSSGLTSTSALSRSLPLSLLLGPCFLPTNVAHSGAPQYVVYAFYQRCSTLGLMFPTGENKPQKVSEKGKNPNTFGPRLRTRGDTISFLRPHSRTSKAAACCCCIKELKI